MEHKRRTVLCMRRGNIMFPIYFPNPRPRLSCPSLVADTANRSGYGIPDESDRCHTDRNSGFNTHIDADIEPGTENEVAYLKRDKGRLVNS